MAAALCSPKLCSGGKLAGNIAVYKVAVVIALAILKGREICFDIPADGFCLNEVHGCSGYVFRLSKRDEGFVRGKVLGGVEFKNVVQNAAGAFSVEVEVDVVGEVHDRGLVGLCGEYELKGIVISPGVMGDGLEGAGIASFSVFGKVHELYGVAVNAAVPNLVLEAFRAAVEVVGAIVDGKSVLCAVQGEMSLGDAVCKAAGNLAGAGTVGKIVEGVLVADYDVVQLAVLVGNYDGYDAGAYA